jgi:hypothetical protein
MDGSGSVKEPDPFPSTGQFVSRQESTCSAVANKVRDFYDRHPYPHCRAGQLSIAEIIHYTGKKQQDGWRTFFQELWWYDQISIDAS